MAHFDRAIPPGGEGKIKLRLNPSSCRGETEKSTLVTTNDPKKSYFMLVLKARATFNEGNFKQ
ncbi:MAG: hypothetical protein ACLGPL_02640 [Acidobacteriota bacterium]